MSPRLMPLAEIPYSGRQDERKARAQYPDRRAALAAARYCIEDAPGCYGGADPHDYGWVVSPDAAEACATEVVSMPGGTVFHPRSYRVYR